MKLTNMQQALIAIAEDGVDPEYRIAGLVEHHACLFGVSEDALRYEVDLYAIPSMVQDVQDGFRTLADVIEELESDFAGEAA